METNAIQYPAAFAVAAPSGAGVSGYRGTTVSGVARGTDLFIWDPSAWSTPTS